MKQLILQILNENVADDIRVGKHKWERTPEEGSSKKDDRPRMWHSTTVPADHQEYDEEDAYVGSYRTYKKALRKAAEQIGGFESHSYVYHGPPDRSKWKHVATHEGDEDGVHTTTVHIDPDTLS